MTFPVSLKTLNETTIAAAFNAHREEMKSEFVAHVEKQLARLVEAYGETIGHVGKASSSFSLFDAYQLTSRLLDRQGLRSFKAIRALPAKFCPVLLEKAAEAYAVETVDAIVCKVLSKVGELEDAELKDVFAGRFVLTGKRGDRSVVIRQTRILNVSSKGKLFHQWPSRIMVDGKRMSAKAFGELPPPGPPPPPPPLAPSGNHPCPSSC